MTAADAHQGPLAIPYVDHHQGPRRVLVLHLQRSSTVASVPLVGVDGRTYVVVWGTVAFEVPADRPVHLSVHLQLDRLAYAASTLLLPQHKAELTYSVSWGRGAELT
ncbi:hypothetical protein [Angustibacter speluncae]